MVCQNLWLFTGQKQKFLREIESNKYAGDQRKIRENFYVPMISSVPST